MTQELNRGGGIGCRSNVAINQQVKGVIEWM